MLTLPPVSPSIRFLTNAQSERVRRMFPGQRRECPTCGDRKTFLWYGQGRDPDTIGEYECPCDDQWRLHRRLLHCGVPDNYQRLGWDDFFITPNPEAVEWVGDYLDDTEARMRGGEGAILYGPRGSGKSLLSYIFIKMLIDKGVDCYAITFHDYLDALTATWRDKEDRDWFNARIRNAPVLMIDDVGREYNKGAGTLGENSLETVLRHRVSRAMPTIITTNENPDELLKTYGGHTASLLSEVMEEFEFEASEGEANRKRTRKRFRQENRDLKITRPCMVG